MQIVLLGPLSVSDGGVELRPRRPKQRALLAVLALRANELVSVEELVAALWGAPPPPSATNALQGHISALRKLFDPDRIETHPLGYRLRLGDDELDVRHLRSLVDRARAAAQPERRAELAAQAGALFRGDPLADFRFEEFAQSEIARLEELRLTAREEWIAASLDLGADHELVSELLELVAANPLRERLRGQLMLSLYRAGRQADALEVYRSGRRALTDELGLEPGPDLQALQRAILTQDPSLARPSRPPPGNVPAEIDAFVGRADELALLRDWVGGPCVRLTTLTGPGGSGKTRLAFEAARELAPRFPDGVWELLVEHSLLKVTSRGSAGLRFELLETVREFAHEQLTASGELQVLERAHARFFVSLAQQLGPLLRTTEDQTAAVFEQLTRASSPSLSKLPSNSARRSAPSSTRCSPNPPRRPRPERPAPDREATTSPAGERHAVPGSGVQSATSRRTRSADASLLAFPRCRPLVGRSHRVGARACIENSDDSFRLRDAMRSVIALATVDVFTQWSSRRAGQPTPAP